MIRQLSSSAWSLPLPPNLAEQAIAEAIAEAQRRAAQGAGGVAPAHQAEWDACAADPRRFIDQHVVIDEPQGEELATVPFVLWPAQATALAALVANRLVIALKARQVGITWLALAYLLWLCLFRPGRVVLLFSKTEDPDAYELLRRVKAMYGRLPDWMRAARPILRDNLSTIEWANGSRVQSLAATRSAGRSFTASAVLLDEFAFMQWGQEVYTALKPVIDGGGQMFIVSTANGATGLFHDLWQKASAGLNNFHTLFLSWRARPDRDDAWRARVAAEALSSALDLQEYPNEPAEAYQATQADRFLPDMLLWDACRETLLPLGPREPLVLALDAAVSGDSFALVGVTRHPTRPADIAVRLALEWLPPRGGQIDFQGTEDAPGPERVVRRLCAVYNVVCVTFDPYQLHDMATRLSREGLAWFREFSQQAERLEADKALLDRIVQRAIAHDGNEALRAHLDHANRKPEPESRKLRIVKRQESLKIDLAVALSMANHVCATLNL